MTEIHRKITLSFLWIFVILNMVYADLIGMLKPGYVDTLNTMSRELSAVTVLTFAILMEFVLIMVVVALVLDRKWNRRVHFFAVPLGILWVLVPATMPELGGETPLSYVFFASVEVIAMASILLLAFRWPEPSTLASSGTHAWLR